MASSEEQDIFTDLDLDPEVFRKLGYKVVDMITDYYGKVREVPVFPPHTSTDIAKYSMTLFRKTDRIQKKSSMSGRPRSCPTPPILGLRATSAMSTARGL